MCMLNMHNLNQDQVYICFIILDALNCKILIIGYIFNDLQEIKLISICLIFKR